MWGSLGIQDKSSVASRICSNEVKGGNPQRPLPTSRFARTTQKEAARQATLTLNGHPLTYFTLTHITAPSSPRLQQKQVAWFE
jgi:hypothetical protein